MITNHDVAKKMHFVDEDIADNMHLLYDDSEERVVRLLADKYNLPYADLRGVAGEPDALKMIPENMAMEALVAPFRINGKTMHIAIRDPENSKMRNLIEHINSTLGEPIIYIASKASLRHIWGRYADIAMNNKVDQGSINLTKAHSDELFQDIKSLSDFQIKIENILKNERANKVSKIIELMIDGAIYFGASDIHTEPESGSVRVRYRMDGILNDVFYTDEETYKLIQSRLKLLSGLKISTHNKAQDGRFTVEREVGNIEMRVSVIPGAYGESFVMRLLDPGNANVSLDKLGINIYVKSAIEHAMTKPNGMILTTGPTGSGKSTTLYSILSKIYSKEIKIITIEDPVEYHIEGISQTNVNKEYGFVDGLRAALRQDPDVIMIGEIRDAETAAVAINAAQTGHLVLSTLHTNNAFGVIPRLLDLGANPKTLVNAITLSIAQRLCRKLCLICKVAITSGEKESRSITNILGEMNIKKKPYAIAPSESYTIYQAGSCDKCHDGYDGRIGIYEGFIMTPELNKIINNNPSEYEIKEAVASQGLTTLEDDAILKLLNGETSYDELLRVIDL